MPPMPPTNPEDDPMMQLNDLYGMGVGIGAGTGASAMPAPGAPEYDGDGLDSEAAGDWDPGMQHAMLSEDEGGDFDPSLGGMGMNDMSPAHDIGLEGLFSEEPPMYGSPPVPALPEEEMPMGMNMGAGMGMGMRRGGSVPPSKFLKYGAS